MDLPPATHAPRRAVSRPRPDRDSRRHPAQARGLTFGGRRSASSTRLRHDLCPQWDHSQDPPQRVSTSERSTAPSTRGMAARHPDDRAHVTIAAFSTLTTACRTWLLTSRRVEILTDVVTLVGGILMPGSPGVISASAGNLPRSLARSMDRPPFPIARRLSRLSAARRPRPNTSFDRRRTPHLLSARTRSRGLAAIGAARRISAARCQSRSPRGAGSAASAHRVERLV